MMTSPASPASTPVVEIVRAYSYYYLHVTVDGEVQGVGSSPSKYRANLEKLAEELRQNPEKARQLWAQEKAARAEAAVYFAAREEERQAAWAAAEEKAKKAAEEKAAKKEAQRVARNEKRRVERAAKKVRCKYCGKPLDAHAAAAYLGFEDEALCSTCSKELNPEAK